MRTTEERLTEKFPNASTQDWFIPMSTIINEARIEAIKECAEVAKTGQGEQWRKDAILKLIDQVK